MYSYIFVEKYLRKSQNDIFLGVCKVAVNSLLFVLIIGYALLSHRIMTLTTQLNHMIANMIQLASHTESIYRILDLENKAKIIGLKEQLRKDEK